MYSIARYVRQDENAHDKAWKERRGPLMQRKYVPRGGAVPSLSISMRVKSVAAGVGYDWREGTKLDG